MRVTFWGLVKGGLHVQTPAEDCLIKTLIQEIRGREHAKIINLGAGQSQVIEQYVANAGCVFTSDRADLEKFLHENDFGDQDFQTSVEDMGAISSTNYDVVYANYLLEHVKDVKAAAREIYRILKSGGIFVTAVPNPRAPEFVLARLTPLSWHRQVRGGSGWETHYAFKNISQLKKTFEENGFHVEKENYWGNTLSYGARFPMVGLLFWLYDGLINFFHLRSWSGNVCLVFRKKHK